MAEAERAVDDSFLDEVDDSFLDEADAEPDPSTNKIDLNKLDRGTYDKWLWASQEVGDPVKRKFVDDLEAQFPQLKQQREAKNEDMKKRVKALQEVPNDALPFSRDLHAAVFGAAPQIMNEAQLAMSGWQPSWDRIVNAFDEAKAPGVARSQQAHKDYPVMMGGAMVPASVALSLATAGVGGAPAGLSSAETALWNTGRNAIADVGTTQGQLSNMGMADDPSTAILATGAGRAIGEGISAIPGALRKLKEAPGRGWDALKLALGKTDDAVAPAAAQADDVARAAAPEQFGEEFRPGMFSKSSPGPTEDTAAMKAIDPALDAAGKGDLPPGKDPEFLRKSKELADMLGQNDTKISELPPPGPRGPDVKHKAEYRGQQFKFPEDNAGWERQPHAWKAGEDSSKPGDVMDLLMSEGEGPNSQAAWEAFEQNELGAGRNRAALDFDSRVNAEPEVSQFGVKTGQGGADLYEPMGVQASAKKAGDQAFADKTKRMPYATLREKMHEMGYTGEGQPFYTDEDFARIAAEVNAQGATKQGGWYKPEAIEREAQKAQAVAPWDDEAIDAVRARGMERLQGIGGKVGAVAGAYEGMKHGGVIGGVGGWVAGEKAGEKAVNKADWVIRKLSYDPAKLRAAAAGDGPLAGAAKFILAGAEEAGETGLKARAFIASMMPSLRELFADER